MKPTKKVLVILAEDAQNSTTFISNCGCTIANAAKRQFNKRDVSEGVDSLSVGNIEFTHRAYNLEEYLTDKERANKMAPDAILKRIVLKIV
jgi:hypothetical protein